LHPITAVRAEKENRRHGRNVTRLDSFVFEIAQFEETDPKIPRWLEGCIEPVSIFVTLDITNRNDPTVTSVAKLIIQLAGNGERDPTRLAKRAIEIVRGSS
jgi:hypothetical protein